MQFLFAEKYKEEEFFTRFAKSKLFMYITPEGKITNFSTEEESMMGMFLPSKHFIPLPVRPHLPKFAFYVILQRFGREL